MAEKIIGTDRVPPDLIAKVRGRAKYAEDFRAEGMVFCKLLLSPMPHARVTRIDASRALRMEGVIDILTPADVPEVNAPAEPALTSEPLYEGEPILALAAVDETTAAAAIEQIRVDYEPLPFVLDPLASLRPGGPNARQDGNIFRTAQDDRGVRELKWAGADFDAARDGRLPMGQPMVEWSVGELDGGFAEAAHVIEETLSHQSLTHHPLESRSALAYWQNGKLFFHGSTQSVARARASLAGLLGLELADVVFISEFCGGGFGSKITVTPQMAIPALLSRKINRPVMMRVSRYEENYIGRGRPGFQAWVRMGFRRDGRVSALDLYIVQDKGPYGEQGDWTTAAEVASLTYQPLAMRFRGVSVYTNTPPRSAQRMPGGMQIVAMLEPLVDKAARELGIDRLAIREINAPGHDAWVGADKEHVTSSWAREAMQLGARAFNWEEKKTWSGRRNGTKVTGIGIATSPFHGGSSGFDGLVLIRPDGRLYIHQGIGNLGTHSFADTARVAAEILGMAWDDCQVIWGDTSRHLPWSSVQAGSQTTHAHTRANHAAATDAKRKIQEIAARDLGGAAADYVVDGGRVFHRANRSRVLTLARVAERAIQLGGRYDGHEVDENLHAMTKASAAALAGTGLMGVAKDTYSHDGGTWSFVIGFVVIELDTETGTLELKEYLAATDCGIVMHPRSLAAQLHGGGVQGFGAARSQKWVFDPRWGAGFAKRFYTVRPPGMLDVPLQMDWVAVNRPDPQTPVGAKGIGEPPIGAGEAALTSAVADALGGLCLCRTPLSTDVILAAVEGRELPYGLLETHY
ncbi:MAG: xanthine dehydrogenase family protein molybdopterin-binding subunit [Gemmatimonadetes bacterium]|nr:xanthine dehydrogenase family protein molybdopterin-binding subunit [Gemmatimonadota bacterium]